MLDWELVGLLRRSVVDLNHYGRYEGDRQVWIGVRKLEADEYDPDTEGTVAL